MVLLGTAEAMSLSEAVEALLEWTTHVARRREWGTPRIGWVDQRWIFIIPIKKRRAGNSNCVIEKGPQCDNPVTSSFAREG
jgi:hypothetical protein